MEKLTGKQVQVGTDELMGRSPVPVDFIEAPPMEEWEVYEPPIDLSGLDI